MSEAIAISYFNKEIQKIDEILAGLRTVYKSIYEFMLGPDFMDDMNKFLALLADFQGKMITMSGLSQTTTPEQQKPPEKPIVSVKLEWYHFIVFVIIVIAVILSGFQIKNETLPVSYPNGTIVRNGTRVIVAPKTLVAFDIQPQLLIGVTIIVALVMFAPNILDYFERMKKKEVKLKSIEDWVKESLDEIRRRYRGAWIFCRQTAVEDLESVFPQYVSMYDKSFIDPKEQFKRTLPTEFLSKIGWLMNVIESGGFARRAHLINAITLMQPRAQTAERRAE